MTERKFTDEEVIRALELCSDKRIHCNKCLYSGKILCISALEADALDLINRQRAEIERRNKIIDKIRKVMDNILLVEFDGQPIPRKNTSRNDVYRACYQIQEILWQIRPKGIELHLVQIRRQNTAATDTNVGGKSEGEQK